MCTNCLSNQEIANKNHKHELMEFIKCYFHYTYNVYFGQKIFRLLLDYSTLNTQTTDQLLVQVQLLALCSNL